VDFCHCGRRGARDRVYTTSNPSSDTKTTGASTDKISRPTFMRSPQTFPSPSWSIGRERSGRRSIISFYPSTNYLCEWGKAVTGSQIIGHSHAACLCWAVPRTLATVLRSSGYKVNAGRAGRANNRNFHHDGRGPYRSRMAVRPVNSTAGDRVLRRPSEYHLTQPILGAPGTMTHWGRPRTCSGTAPHGPEHFRQHPS
jgi:hypothetical protein